MWVFIFSINVKNLPNFYILIYVIYKICFCELIHIHLHLYLCKWNTLLPNSCVSLILDNICILLLNIILSDPLVQDIYPLVNPWHLWNQYKNMVLFIFYTYQEQDKGHIICDSKLKFHSHHDTHTFLLQYSILKIISSILFTIIYSLCLLFLYNIVPLLIIFIVFSLF